jgi:hypothetical protein
LAAVIIFAGAKIFAGAQIFAEGLFCAELPICVLNNTKASAMEATPARR